MVSWIAIWLLIKSLNMVAKQNMVAKVFELFSIPIFLYFKVLGCKVSITYGNAILALFFLSVEILGKIDYSFPVILQMVSLLGISKPGKHKAATLTKF